MAKDTHKAIWPSTLLFSNNSQRGRRLFPLPLPLYSLLILSVLSSLGHSNVPGGEYDWGSHPKLVCMPLPPNTDPSCFPPDGVTLGLGINGHNNGHADSLSNVHGTGRSVGGLPNNPRGSSSRLGIADETKATILHLRENLVRQKETILDQRETIRELTAKLTLCEGFAMGVSGHHNEDHHGHHGSQQSSHHHHSDPHYPLNGYHNDHHRGKPPFVVKHGFSPEQAGKTLQTLKERLENLQARNSSSTYSSSLKDLLQRKIYALEEQLHHHYDGHNDYDTHEFQSMHDNHHDDHHGAHLDDHDNTRYFGHHYSPYYGNHYDQNTHHNDIDHYSNHNEDNHENQLNEHHNDHHDHGNNDENQHHIPLKPTSRARGAYRTETRPKNPDGFQIGFPMHTNYMYGRIKHTLLNEIFALTVCLWIKGGSGPGIGTPFSYSIPGQANELVLIEWGNSPFEFLVNDKAVTLPLSLKGSKWHHLCVTWSTRDGVWEAYQNGVKRGSGENLAPWHLIKPGGVFILGQEQDTLGGRFDATQSFVGEMSDLQLWSHVLNSEEIDNQATCSSHLTGDVIAWSENNVELHGGVTKYPFDPCH